MFYDPPDAALKAEIGEYVAKLEVLRSTGRPAPGAAAFQFSNPAANSPLFDPDLALRRTLALTLGREFCWAVSGGDVVAYASDGTIASPLIDTAATVNHFESIVDAAEAGPVTFTITGGDLVSQGIPVEPVTAAPAAATPFMPDTVRAQWIAGIESHAMGVAAGFVPTGDIADRLLGEPRGVDVLAEAVWEHAATLGDTPDDVQVLAAAFGRFGALPVLAVWFDEGYILIDGTNGAAAGPYADGVAYDPTELLLAHGVYQPGTGAIMVDLETGCESSGLGARWRTTPPPGYSPRAVTPATPPTPPTTPAGRPHHWSDYDCDAVVGGGCICESKGWMDHPTKPPVRTRVRCACPHDGSGGCTTQPNTVFPPAPPAGCGPGTSGSCNDQQYFY